MSSTPPHPECRASPPAHTYIHTRPSTANAAVHYSHPHILFPSLAICKMRTPPARPHAPPAA